MQTVRSGPAWAQYGGDLNFEYVVHYRDKKDVTLLVTGNNLAGWIADPVRRFPKEENTFTTAAVTVPVPQFGQPMDLVPIRNGRSPQSGLLAHRAEIARIELGKVLKGVGLAGRVMEDIRLVVEAIVLQFLASQFVGLGLGMSPATVKIDHRVGCFVQILGREIRPQISTVAEDRAVLHQPILLKDVLTGHDVVAGEERAPIFGNHAPGNRRRFRVDTVGQVKQHRESRKKRQDGDLQPQG